jgi:hypothetical protein
MRASEASLDHIGQESRQSVLGLMAAGVAFLLLIYVGAFLVVVEFVYCHVIAAPSKKLLGRLGWRLRPTAPDQRAGV